MSLSAVRDRIKKLKNQVEVLKGVPIPPSDLREKVQSYVRLRIKRAEAFIDKEAVELCGSSGLLYLLA